MRKKLNQKEIVSTGVLLGLLSVGIFFLVPSWAHAAGSTFGTDAFPSELHLIIEEGSACTTFDTVDVRVEGKGFNQVVLGSSDFFTTEQWQDALPGDILSYSLPAGDGEKKIYALFKSSMNLTSSVVYGTIVLDKEGNCGKTNDQNTTEPGSSDGSVSGTPVSSIRYVRTATVSTVYRVENGTRRPFLNETVYATWESGWDKIERVTDAELAALRLGSPMMPKAGAVLVKSMDSPVIFATSLDASGRDVRQAILSETDAAKLYGTNWSAYVVDVDPILAWRYREDEAVDASRTIDTSMMMTRMELERRTQ